ncbi:hypothetical protein NP511_09250 [Natrinema thermotolerans]|uniref:Uncharacterized protein n=1 Tax=Natrinema thermotolerans TaxID=121872 RepID=A0AAF0T374_9EURY|nr:hypothetical protein [Natrinema thermotolerans]WMT09798.1 hypothetical protein NP511_09250 [Natrinema thermotolerans]
MFKQHSKTDSDFEIPKVVDRVTTVATVTISLSGELATEDLIRDLREKVGEFDERVHYGGRLWTKIDSKKVSSVITVNSIASQSPQTNPSTENTDRSDRIRINSKTTVSPENIMDGLHISLRRTRNISEDLNSPSRKKGAYSFLVKVHSNIDGELSFGRNGLTDRSKTDNGYLAESFENKIKVKQIPESESEVALVDLKTLVEEKLQDLD